MLTPVRSGQFRRDVKRAEKRGKDLRKLRHVLELLIAGEALPSPKHLRLVWALEHDSNLLLRYARV